MNFRPAFRPFLRLGFEVNVRPWQSLRLLLGVVSFEIHSMTYGPGWWSLDVYIDTWFGTLGQTFEFGE